MELLAQLQSWYLSQCDGDWEHQYGVTIESLDNPGWRLQADLTGTSCAGKAFTPIKLHRSEHDWIHCHVEGTKFVGAGGPENLQELLTVFLDWTEQT